MEGLFTVHSSVLDDMREIRIRDVRYIGLQQHEVIQCPTFYFTWRLFWGMVVHRLMLNKKLNIQKKSKSGWESLREWVWLWYHSKGGKKLVLLEYWSYPHRKKAESNNIKVKRKQETPLWLTSKRDGKKCFKVMACRIELILTYHIKHGALPKLEIIKHPLFIK